MLPDGNSERCRMAEVDGTDREEKPPPCSTSTELASVGSAQYKSWITLISIKYSKGAVHFRSKRHQLQLPSCSSAVFKMQFFDSIVF